MNETLQYIHSRTRFGSRLGLERMRELLIKIGSPEKKLKFVHVAGTNGKGSTTTFIQNVLTAAGYKCGRYISPYILDFNERISIDGVSISADELKTTIDLLRPIVEQMDDAVTEFELTTAAALYYFSEKGCDIVALETGLGGRLDATNVIPPPLCCVLTKISFDHMQYLGNTIEEIAGEKCGIIKQGSAVVTYPLQFARALEVIERVSSQLGCALLAPDINALQIMRCELDGSLIEYKGKTLKVPLAGRHQIYNAITAIAALEYISAACGFKLTANNVAKGIGSTFFPARLEIMCKKPLVLLDSAHNADGMRTLCDALDNFAKGKKIVALFGVFSDKDYLDEIALLSGSVSSFVTVTPTGERGFDGRKLAELCEQTAHEAVYFEDYRKAYNCALQRAGENGVVVICGCLHMASDMRSLILQQFRRPPT